MNRRDVLALAGCLGAGFATLLDQSVVTYTIPSLSAELGATPGGVQWFLAVYSLTFGMGLVPGGRLGDAYGRRGMFLAGLAVFLIGAILSVFSPDIGWAIAGRSVQGFGAGVISAQVLGIIQDIFVGRDRIRALSAYGIAGAASAIAGPLLAGLVLGLAPSGLAWRAVLALNVPFILATAVLALLFAPRGHRRLGGPPSLDLIGIGLTAGAVLLVTAPVIDPGIGPVLTGISIAGLIIVVAAIVWWERRLERRGGQPLFASSLMRSRGFTTGTLVALLWFGASVAHGMIVTLFLLQNLGLSAFVIVALLVPGSIARIVTSALSSRVNDALKSAMLPVCLAVQLAAATTLAVLSGSVDGAAFLILVICVETVLGAAAGALEPPLRATTLSFARQGEYGLAASFLQLSQRLAATFCVALVTGIAFSSGSTLMNTAGLGIALAVCSALLLGAFLISLRYLARAAKDKLPLRPVSDVTPDDAIPSPPRTGLRSFVSSRRRSGALEGDDNHDDNER